MVDIETISQCMVTIPGGESSLRDDRVKRKWSVEIKPFLLGKFQVTQVQYGDVTQAAPSTFHGDQRPIETVAWNDAINFCNQLSNKSGLTEYYLMNHDGLEITQNLGAEGYRLPTDAEWEYACRAGTAKSRYGEIEQIAWFEKNSENHTHAVGMKEPNEWGLYDMLGNVWEWCWDIYDQKEYGSYRVFRGGGWSDKERGCLASNRRRSHPTFKIDDLGFRVARSI